VDRPAPSPTQVPEGVDPNRPTAARIYDRFLGGTHNFAADRAVAERAIELVPEIPTIVKANRAFLHRAVRFAIAQGVRQFIDLGSGIPTQGNVHEVAREARPDVTVAYVDMDPTAVIHARSILGSDPQTVALHNDLLNAEPILADPTVRQLIDFAEPVCYLMIAVLHFIPDSAALLDAMRRYREAAAPGSYLVMSHGTGSARPGELNNLAELYSRTDTPLIIRDRVQVEGLFEGWEMVEPGITYISEWRPDPGSPKVDDPASYMILAGVGRKP
jgi:hypothetical protein